MCAGCVDANGEEILATFEETTNLPLEIQGALDELTRRAARPRNDLRAVGRLLRRAPDHRLEPYEDFAGPRRRARANLRNLIRRGRRRRLVRAQERSRLLRFAPGFEPDFARGVVELSRSHSRFYGGAIRKFRILSRNRQIQYQFVAAPRHAGSSRRRRSPPTSRPSACASIDVHAAEELCVPGYEYCYVDESTRPPTLHSQIPTGFAGAPSELDPARARCLAVDRAAPGDPRVPHEGARAAAPASWRDCCALVRALAMLLGEAPARDACRPVPIDGRTTDSRRPNAIDVYCTLVAVLWITLPGVRCPIAICSACSTRPTSSGCAELERSPPTYPAAPAARRTLLGIVDSFAPRRRPRNSGS